MYYSISLVRDWLATTRQTQVARKMMYPQMVAGWLLQILVYCWVKPVKKSMLHQKLPFAVADCHSHT